jgi:hypothetical protein
MKLNRKNVFRLVFFKGAVSTNLKHLILLTFKEEFYCMVDLSNRVGRVLSFFSSRRNWDSPTPNPAGESPPPLVRGGGHTRLRERGEGVPIQTRRQTLWNSRFICTLWRRDTFFPLLWIVTHHDWYKGRGGDLRLCIFNLRLRSIFIFSCVIVYRKGSLVWRVKFT